MLASAVRSAVRSASLACNPVEQAMLPPQKPQSHLGQLIDAYDPYVKIRSKKGSLFNKEGRSYKWDSWKTTMQNNQMLRELKKELPSFAPRKFVPECKDAYVAIKTAYAKKDVRTLEKYLTPDLLGQWATFLRARDPAEKHTWRLDRWHGDAGSIVWVRMATIGVSSQAEAETKKDKQMFAQLTVLFESAQTLQVEGGSTSGFEKRTLRDTWVFERKVTDPRSTWRLCGVVPPAKED